MFRFSQTEYNKIRRLYDDLIIPRGARVPQLPSPLVPQNAYSYERHMRSLGYRFIGDISPPTTPRKHNTRRGFVHPGQKN